MILFREDNPGHVLACRGIREVTDRLLAATTESLPEPAEFGTLCRFRLRHAGADVDLRSSIQHVLDGTIALAPDMTETDKIAALDLSVPGLADPIRLDWWRDVGLRAFKMWSGRLGSYQLARSMLVAARKIGPSDEPFRFTVPMTSRFGVDPESSLTTLASGFSPDRCGIAVLTAPVVELFAVIGLQFWRFQDVGPNTWEYVLNGVRRRFRQNSRGKCKALGWAGEVFRGLETVG